MSSLCRKFNLVVYDNKFKMSYDKSNNIAVKQNLHTISTSYTHTRYAHTVKEGIGYSNMYMHS